MKFILPTLVLVFCIEVNASPIKRMQQPIQLQIPQTHCQNHICQRLPSNQLNGNKNNNGNTNNNGNKNNNGNTNNNGNKNNNGNTNNNGNKNNNGNTNDNKNTNTNKINVNVNATGGSSTSSSSSSGSSGNTNYPMSGFNNPGISYNYSPSFTDGRSFSPSFGGPTYSPGFSSPSYGGVGGGVPVGGFGGGFVGEAVPVANNQADNPLSAWLTVDLPHENSDVYLNGIKMPQKGITRKYVSPPLNKQTTYHYALKVVWPDALGGKKVHNTNIELKAGDEVRYTVPGALNALPPLPNQGPSPPKKEEKVEDEESKLKSIEKRIQFRLSFAKEMFDAGKIDKGKRWLEDIILEYPDSKGAEEAKNLLSKIK